MAPTLPAEPAAPLPITGERTVPEVPEENYWFRRHETVYAWLLDRCRDSVVLEAGCGEGYGAGQIAEVAGKVIGIDYDALTAAHAGATYPKVSAMRGDLAQLPLKDESVDVIVCLQVIEHLQDQPGFVAECARVLKPGGLLFMSTPNRLTFSPLWEPGTPHVNPFHTRELSADELIDLMSEKFDVEEVLGVFYGERLSMLDAKFDTLISSQFELPPAEWSEELAAAIASIAAEDFVIERDRRSTPADSALDLIAVATRSQ